jgi:hypothetical protein
MLDGSGVKAMPGLISTPNSGSLQKNKKIQFLYNEKYFNFTIPLKKLIMDFKRSIFTTFLHT